MMFDGKGRPLRLLPWHNEYGAPCYLSTDNPASRISRLADEVEADLIDSAEYVLTEARALLAEGTAGERELRFVGVRLAESLGDTLQIAAGRGVRLEAELMRREAEGSAACGAGCCSCATGVRPASGGAEHASGIDHLAQEVTRPGGLLT